MKITQIRAVSFCFFLIQFLGNPIHSFAFKSLGHKRIELWAYTELMKTLGGQKILYDLYDAKLMAGGSFKVPMAKSAAPDFSLERQFYQKRQPYHFMASNKAVMWAAKRGPAASGNTVEREAALLEKALPECYQLLFLLFNETIKYPPGSRQSGRGIYVLMHIIMDSFSAEHATRNEQDEIISVKGWKTNRLGWPPNAKDLSSTGNLNFALLHRGLFANKEVDADEKWTNVNCKKNNKHQKTCTCPLSEVGIRTGLAVQDLLKAVHQGLLDSTQIEVAWLGFVQKHLMPYGYVHVPVSNKFQSNTGNREIQFNYSAEVNLPQTDKNSVTAFDFDRFPEFVLSASGSYYPKQQNPIIYGVSFLFNHVPYTAEQNFVKRLAVSYGGEILFLRPTGNETFQLNRTNAETRIKGNFGTYLSIFNNMPFRLYSLASFSPSHPFRKGSRPGLGVGVEMSGLMEFLRLGIILNPFNRKVTHTSVRLAFGYEFDSAGLPGYHNLGLRIGLNSWHVRVPY